MKKIALSFVLLAGLIFLLTQCGTADAGAKTADTFFSEILKGNFEKAAAMVECNPLDSVDIIPNLQAMANNPVNGYLKSFKKSFGFSTNVSNGITTVEIPYVLSYEKGEQSFNVVIVNRGAGYKIVSVQ